MTLLTYSTWLVVGSWLIATGAQEIYKVSNSDNSFLIYLIGVVRIFIGVHALRSAYAVTLQASGPQGFSLRVLTFILLILMIGAPLFVLIFQTLASLFTGYQPDEKYLENGMRIVYIGGGYLLATLFAGWRLAK